MGTRACLDVLKKRKITLRIRTLELPARSLVSLLATQSSFPKIIIKMYIKETGWKNVKSIHMTVVASLQASSRLICIG